jgi:hypothetical protein
LAKVMDHMATRACFPSCPRHANPRKTSSLTTVGDWEPPD